MSAPNWAEIAARKFEPDWYDRGADIKPKPLPPVKCAARWAGRRLLAWAQGY